MRTNRGKAESRKQKAEIKDTASFTDPNLEQLREEFTYTLQERDSSIFARARLNHETRNCIWPGQTADGRKWKIRAGEDQVFPWPGASDARVPLVDTYIRKHIAFLMVLERKMGVRVNATEINDEAWADRMTNFLRWMKQTQMRERRAENELLANYLLERGSAVMSVLWCRKKQLQYEEIDRETLAQMILQKLEEGDQRFADLPGMILDPSLAKQSAELLAELFPDVASGRLERVAQDIGLHGYARFPRPAVVMNRPKVIARCPNEDIFLSPDASDLEDASVHEVEVMRESKFRSYAKDYEWDEAWTEQMLDTQRGVVDFGNMEFQLRQSRQTRMILPGRGDGESRKLFLVAHSYRRLADDEGVPGIFYTVWNPHLGSAGKSSVNSDQLVAKHELLNYAHAQMPHVLFTQERRSRRPDDSRGYGEIAHTFQAQIKSQWDGRIDRSSIATLPPSYHPHGQAPDKWGPGVQVPTNSPTGYGFMDTPKYDGGSEEIEESVRQMADDYFGFQRDPETMMDAQNLLQKLGDDWMDGHQRVDTQVLQLCQQFMPDSFYYRVVGSSQGKPIHSSREEIQGQFDISVGYEVENLDPVLKKAKLELLRMAYEMDATGVIDRTEGLKIAMDIIDPNLGERLLKPAEHASLAEIEDESKIFVQLMMGVQTFVKPGQAYQLRMQTLQQLLQSNKTAQNLYRNNEETKVAFDKRFKDLQQAFQNAPGGPNAVIGRGGPAFKPQLT